MKKRTKIIIGVVAFILILCGAGFTAWKLALNPYRETISNKIVTKDLDSELTKEAAQEDLQYLMSQLKDYHPAYLDGSKELTDAVEEQYDEEISQLGDTVTVLQLWQASARIMANMHDGHTNVYPYFFLTEYLEGGNLDLSDKELISIDGIAVKDLYNKFRSQFSYELESYADFKFKSVISREEYMRFIGIDTSNGVDITYKENGVENTVHSTFRRLNESQSDTQTAEEEFVYYEVDEQSDLAIFTLDACYYNEEYCDVLNQFFSQVIDKDISNVIVDLRNNGGGNSMVINEFLTYLDVDSYKGYASDVRLGPYLWKNKPDVYTNERKDKIFDGQIYILTSSQTFSSANMFAVMISDNELGTIVGEIPGNMPSSYGDVLSFQMPNSKLCLGISYKVFHRPDLAVDHEPLIPDIEVDADLALQKIKELIGQ